jgi:RNA polymerase sigma-54 factor
MIQSMEILQLPIMALEERIQQELLENPVLVDEETEVDPAAPEPTAADGQETAAPEAQAAADDSADRLEDEIEQLLAMNEDWTESLSSHRVSRDRSEQAAERKHDVMQNMVSRPESLHEYLLHQFSFFDLCPEVRRLGELVIHNLDEHGFLATPLEELVKIAGQGADLQAAEEALSLVQKLDPPGVGARDLKECLLMQITPDTPHREVLVTLISNHWDDLLHNRLPVIQRKTGYSLETIQAAREGLKGLKTQPGTDFQSQNIPYVVPDVAVEPDGNGGYKVRLQDDYTPQLHISRRYQQLLRSNDTDLQTKRYIQKKIQAARWLIESIEQRRGTLAKVSQAIVDHQKEFLDRGPEHIEPLKMQQIADRVGVHVTTVSRAVDEKWVQTPRGIFPLKRFFGGGTVTADGESVAWDNIRQKLRSIIDSEDKRKPYSDEELVEQMAKQGLQVARRTVTKYRKAMGIPSSRQRREF